MKFKTILLLILLGTLVLLQAREFEVNVHLKEPRVIQRDGHMLVDIPECIQLGTGGEPLRPHYPVKILLPPGETLTKIDLVVNNSTQLPLILPLLPKQADRPLSWGNSDKGFIKKEAVYSQEIYNTEKINADLQWFRGVGIVMGTIDPLTYYPLSGTAELADNFTLKVYTESTVTEPKLSKDHYDLIMESVQNPETLTQYSFIDDQAEKLLIITPDLFLSAVDTLVKHYAKYGIEAEIMRINEIQLGNHPGRDLQEKIRYAIKEVYLNDGLDYVLLAGNSTHIPHRGLSCEVLSGESWVTSEDIPADLYYVALDGDWDRNANGKFGEYLVETGFDEADLLPEIAIGRMPAATLEELENMISKSIRYQREPIIDELDKQTFFGEFLYADPESWAADYLELLIGKHTDNGYNTEGIPSTVLITKWYDQESSDQWDKQTIINEFSNGTSFVHHDGHCNYTSMMKFSTNEINDSDFVMVNGIDHTTPVLYSHGCNCGGFDRSDCIGSKIVTSPYITVGAVLNSRYGWFNEGQTEGPSIHLHREFENAIYGLGFDHFGWVLGVSKIKTAPWLTAPNQHEQNALRWNYYAQNLLGDPAMGIYSDVPEIPEVYYDANQYSSDIAKVGVNVMISDQDPIEDATVAVLDSNGLLIGFGKTDVTGYTEIELPAYIDVGESIHCYITGHNIIPTDSLLTVRRVSNFPVSHMMPRIYPNPFNPSTSIEYSIPYQATVDIRLYDIRGKFIKMIYSGIQTAGAHKIAFKGGDLASGIYICRVQVDDLVTNIKMTLLK